MSIKEEMSTVSSGITLVKQIDEMLEIFRPYKPKVKNIQINYASKYGEIKYLLNIPNDIKRMTKGRLEIPTSKGFIIEDVWDMDAIEPIKIEHIDSDGTWIFYLDKFPKSQNYLVTVKGNLTEEFLDKIVSVKCAANPTHISDNDCYWIHAALKDVKLLKDIWIELNIERVNVDVKIGVERFFSPLMPKEISEKMKIQKELLDAVAQGRRNISGLQSRYRSAMLKTSISPVQLYELFLSLVSNEAFSNYIKVDSPFIMGYIEPERNITSVIPNKVKVGVTTNLNYDNPAAKGELIFYRTEYQKAVEKSLNDLVE